MTRALDAGSSRRVGRGCAEELAELGATVCVTGRDDERRSRAAGS